MPNVATTISEIRQHKRLSERLFRIANAITKDSPPSALWLGAGLSAKYAGLPTWNAFLRTVASKNFVAGSQELITANMLIQTGKTALAAEFISDSIGSKFTDHLVSVFSNILPMLPDVITRWNIPSIITTNYDINLESHLKLHSVVLPSSGMAALISRHPKIVKLHGTIDRPETCIASISQYVRNYDNNLEWYIAQIFSTRSVIFFGSSMSESEPFFKIVHLIGKHAVIRNRHYAVVSVPSEAAAKQLGKRLENFGIELLPYIPDPLHSFIDELFSFVETVRSSPSAIGCAAERIQSQINDQRWIDGGVALSNLVCHLEFPETHRKLSADLVFKFIRDADADSNSAHDMSRLAREFNFAEVVMRVYDIINDPSPPTGKALRSLFRTLQIVFNKSDDWSVRLPSYAKRKYNELVEEWEQNGRKHPKETVPKFNI